MEILMKIIEQIEKKNPYKLIFKGGTALSILHLKHHRESEDLDFDADIKYLDEYNAIKGYFINIFNYLKEQKVINDYKIGKTGLAATNRFHMKIQFILYKTFQTKIDIDFIKPSDKLKVRGELLYYNIERMFISKIITFTERQEFKDFIDIAFMLPKIDLTIYENKTELAKLIQRLIDTVDERSLIERFEFLSRNVDLKILGLRKGEVRNLITRTFRDLRSAVNLLKK
jgi:predicted nucleotidyltransferase component of viral defense system